MVLCGSWFCSPEGQAPHFPVVSSAGWTPLRLSYSEALSFLGLVRCSSHSAGNPACHSFPALRGCEVHGFTTPACVNMSTPSPQTSLKSYRNFAVPPGEMCISTKRKDPPRLPVKLRPLIPPPVRFEGGFFDVGLALVA